MVQLRRLLVAAASAGTGFLLLCTLGFAMGHPDASAAALLRLAWCVAPLAATVYFAVAVARTDPATRFPRAGLSAIGLGPGRLMILAAVSTAVACTLGSMLALLFFLHLRGDLTGLPFDGDAADVLAADEPLPLPAALTLLALVPITASAASAVALRGRGTSTPPAASHPDHLGRPDDFDAPGSYDHGGMRARSHAHGHAGEHRPANPPAPVDAPAGSGVPGASGSHDGSGERDDSDPHGPFDWHYGSRTRDTTDAHDDSRTRGASNPHGASVAHDVPGSHSALGGQDSVGTHRGSATGVAGGFGELGETNTAHRPGTPDEGGRPLDPYEALSAPRPAPGGLPWGTALLAAGLAIEAYASRTGPVLGPAPGLTLPEGLAGGPVGVLIGWGLTALGLALAGPGATHLCGRLLQAVRPGALRLLAGRVLMEEAGRIGRPLGLVCAVASGAYAMATLYTRAHPDIGPLTALGALLVAGCSVATLLTAAVEARQARADITAALERLGAPAATLRSAAALRAGALLAVLGPLTWAVGELTALPLTG